MSHDTIHCHVVQSSCVDVCLMKCFDYQSNHGSILPHVPVLGHSHLSCIESPLSIHHIVMVIPALGVLKSHDRHAYSI